MQNLHPRRLLIYLIGCPPMRAEFKFAPVMANLALRDSCGLALQSAQAIIFHVVFFDVQIPKRRFWLRHTSLYSKSTPP